MNRGGKVITAGPILQKRLNVTADFGLINSSDAASDPFRDLPVQRICSMSDLNWAARFIVRLAYPLALAAPHPDI
jgi:hypothetical protein